MRFLSEIELGWNSHYRIPIDDGSLNQVLKTNGNGVLTWQDETDTTYTAGISISGTEFSHGSTSSATGVDNSGQNFIQDISLDAYGHVTALTSAQATGASTVYSPDVWQLLTPQTIPNGSTTYRAFFSGKIIDGTTGTVGINDDTQIQVTDAGIYEISYDACLKSTYTLRQVITSYVEVDDGLVIGSAMSNYLRTPGATPTALNQGNISSVTKSFYCSLTANAILRFTFEQTGPSNFTGIQSVVIQDAFAGIGSTFSIRRIV